MVASSGPGRANHWSQRKENDAAGQGPVRSGLLLGFPAAVLAGLPEAAGRGDAPAPGSVGRGAVERVRVDQVSSSSGSGVPALARGPSRIENPQGARTALQPASVHHQ
ncbi:hypothetical protein ABZ471_48575 [Streptomyces sp. NPDC005728]|uniref:hypothetical protein n=1 Tax=Streptomyces sp. NPDC005728 TaxID=3157054 RepID=UPI0033EB4741